MAGMSDNFAGYLYPSGQFGIGVKGRFRVVTAASLACLP